MKTIRTDKARPGDLIAGTDVSGAYDVAPRRLESIARAPEHEKRKDGMHAYLLEWTSGQSNVYYGDTPLILQQRP